MQVGGTEAALFDYARGGPQWGADALIIGPPQVMTLPALHFTPCSITDVPCFSVSQSIGRVSCCAKVASCTVSYAL